MKEERRRSCGYEKWNIFVVTCDRISLIELEIKDTTCTTASCLDLYLEIKSDSWLRTKKDDFNWPIVKIYIK
jgi:hypothetical protein